MTPRRVCVAYTAGGLAFLLFADACFGAREAVAIVEHVDPPAFTAPQFDVVTAGVTASALGGVTAFGP